MDMKETSNKKIVAALVGNILPLVGVLFFDWSVFAILLSYWLENVVIGIYQVLKMRRAALNYPVNEKNKFVMGPLRPITAGEKIFYTIFFCVHYGLFLFGHLQFLRFFGGLQGDVVVFNSIILLTVVPFFVTHGKLYFKKYIGEKEYEKIPLMKLFIGPYRRILVMHTTIIFGSIPLLFFARVFPQVGVIVVILKIVLDVVLKEKEFAFWKKIENKI